MRLRDVSIRRTPLQHLSVEVESTGQVNAVTTRLKDAGLAGNPFAGQLGSGTASRQVTPAGRR